MDSRMTTQAGDPETIVSTSTIHSGTTPAAALAATVCSASEIPRQATTKDAAPRRSRTKSRKPETENQYKFADLRRRMSEFSILRGEEDLLSGYSQLKARYEAGKQDKEWPLQEIRSVHPDILDNQLVAHFEQDLTMATTALLEAVRGGRFVPNEPDIQRIHSTLMKGSSRGGIKLDAAPGNSTPSVAELIETVRSSTGQGLLDDFGILFRSILPNHRSRLHFMYGLDLLPAHSKVLGLAKSGTAGSTSLDDMATSAVGDDGSDVSDVSTDWRSLPWEHKVEKALSITEIAEASGKAHLLRRAADLREALGSSLERQPLLQD